MKRFILQVFSLTCISLILVACGGSNVPPLPNKIMVTGSSEMEITPDEIYVRFTLTEFKNKAGKKVVIQQLKTDFLDVCKQAGIAASEIQTSDYSGSENWNYSYWYYKKDTEITNSLTYTIKVKTLSKIDKIVNQLDRNAVENFYIVRTSHSKLEKFRRKVKENAVKASKTKAIYLAKAVGEEVGRALLIEEITDGDRGSDYPMYKSNESVYSNSIMASTTGSYNSSESPSIEKIKLRFEVKAEYELE